MIDPAIHDVPVAINSQSVRRALRFLLASAIVFIVFVFVAYFLTFHDSVSLKQETWGQFGDFVGGTLNPILSFLSLLALVFTVLLQIHQLDIARAELKNSQSELTATREELKRSADAQHLTATALEEQAKHAVISAKLAALSSALSVTTEALTQARSESAFYGHFSADKLLQRKEAINSEILNITEQLCGNQE